MAIASIWRAVLILARPVSNPGPKPILSFAGRDATAIFNQVHEHILAQVKKNRARMQIGEVADGKL